MNNFRTYGKAPYQVAVIHGGPGAPGEMAPVARELSSLWAVLEPLQTKTTLKEQLEELKTTLKKNAHLPITLIGHSWGAMLSYIFTAHNPSFVKKLILVGSGVFEAQYASSIIPTRLSRLSEDERARLDALTRTLNDPTHTDKNAAFAKLGELDSKADSYDPLPHKNEVIDCQYALYESVWKEAEALRSSGELIAIGRNIHCPVLAIHGDYDPHPAEGITAPLSKVVNDFHFILLKHCGHHPWYEKHAKEQFYTILKQELSYLVN